MPRFGAAATARFTLSVLALMTIGSFPAALSAQVFTRITDALNPIVTDSGPSGYSGASWIDYDGDGDLDLYANNNFLYRNDGGGTFVRVVTFIGAFQGLGTGNGNAWADYDNDGDLDVYVTGNTSVLYRNNGSGSFTQESAGDMGLTQDNRGWACAWGDVNNDGNVDLYISHPCGFVGACVTSHLLINDGPPNYTFTRQDTGVVVTGTATYTVGSWADYDLDGDQDLFVGSGPASSVPATDNLYQNMLSETGQAFFQRITTAPIATDLVDGQLWNWIDYDNDGDLDAYLTNWGGGGSVQQNNLYRNDAGTYVRVLSGDIVTDAFSSLANIWGDFDNDGDLDCHVTNDAGALDRYYRNEGNGSFTSLSLAPTTEAITHRGGTAGDYDDDGDLDLFLVGPSSARRLYRNDTNNGNAWLRISCLGGVSNRSGIGARIRLLATIGGSPVWQMREISSQNSFNGHNMLPAHFGLGNATTIDSVVVHWPSGIVDGFAGIGVNQMLTAVEGSGLGLLDAPLGSPGNGALLTLHGAAPNPFRTGTRIAFTLSEERRVRLRLFDLAGRMLSTNLDGRRGPGRHEVQIAGDRLPGGIVFYVLEAGDTRRTGRLLHLP